MNKAILSLASFFLAVSSTFAQSNLTNQLIWASPEFSGEFYGGLNSMSDGNHYTVLEESDAVGASIVKYSYLTGEKVAVVATPILLLMIMHLAKMKRSC